MRKPIIYLLVALLIFAAAAFVGCEKVWKDVVDSPDISGATDPGGSGSPANDSEDPEEKGELVTLREAYEKGYIDR
ncbi:MAG: hypothetical protein J6126_03455, partial [Clostridia bacterium]|nr:hypothetical protein [Clostridia bacterium]